jgi:tetratricopeptide (TPR) repeat protein
MTATTKSPTIDEAKRAYELRPQLYASSYQLGAVLLAHGDAAAAEPMLSTAARHVDDARGAAAELWANALTQLSRFREAGDALMMALRRRPQDADLWLGAVLTWTKAGDDAQANHARARLAALRNDAASWADLGCALTRGDKHREALEAFQRAQQLDASFFDRAPYEAAMWKQSQAGVL